MYYIKQDNSELGPFTFGQMKSMWSAGQLTVRTLFRMEEDPDWIPIGKFSLAFENDDQFMESQANEIVSAIDENNRDLIYAMGKKSVATACLLNLLIPGAGYIYAGKILTGIFVMFIILPIAAVMSMSISGIPLIVLYIICFIDSFLAVDAANAKLAKKTQPRHT